MERNGAKVFYKSLDHVGLTFKQADKKLLTVKQLVSEISTVKVEQQNKRLHPLTPKPQEQLNYDFKDNEVLFDILKLAEVFINKSSTYSAHDRKSCYNFYNFSCLCFSVYRQKPLKQHWWQEAELKSRLKKKTKKVTLR